MLAIIIFQGFTESDAQRTGTEDLYYNVIRKFAREDVTTYHPRRWTADVKNLASEISRQGIRNVVVISYSHGQSACVDFAKALKKLSDKSSPEVTIDLWLACDPVYRPSWLPRWNWIQPLAFRALTKSVRITVPQNIRRVTGVRQNISWPFGHDLKPSSPATVVEDLPFLNYCHTAIDQAPEWFSLVKNELNQWANPKP